MDGQDVQEGLQAPVLTGNGERDGAQHGRQGASLPPVCSQSC